MSAYLSTFIYGNESFGGYISLDGSASQPVEHDMIYQIEPGPHHIDFYSTSNRQRKAGAFQAAVYSNTSSSGAILDALERREALKNLGDKWSIDVFVGDGQVMTLSVRSSGNSIVGSPVYIVEDLSDEQIEALDEQFEKIHAAYVAEMNRPRRKPGQIVWGIILLLLAAFGAYNYYGTGAYLSGEYEPYIPIIALGILVVVGLLLFINGVRKKVRRK